ncbi:antitoxin [Pollutimonas harenae]|uniref:AbrB/MazE/SpoVT family DNA-binding domain-containing protein n=1 Tax=Pollutimonas harenae TaxID=657015 RepID=A0A853H004_9BURK|nr:AbrB/MazE/SpoVT family DNA-binding domain-containing protein [Pollutimonas harenae]NYT85009.1 AbrB/MazE/SpoVT family DNA-binding domain-containing protein [Pollutimonas harenae]TEA72605.1 AbrB/MazE/SpoVT family DNA-binding domain-containing protein [Pollutimonas harenae]
MTIPAPSSKPHVAKLFRNNGRRAVHIPAEFELPSVRVLIRREGARLIIEAMTGRRNIVELLDLWKKAEPLGPEDQFPDIADTPVSGAS